MTSGLAPEVDARERHPLAAAPDDAEDEAIDEVRHDRPDGPLPEDGAVQQQQDKPREEEVVREPEGLVVAPFDDLGGAAVDDDHDEREELAGEARANELGAGRARVPRHLKRLVAVEMADARRLEDAAVERRVRVVVVVGGAVPKDGDPNEVLGAGLVEDDVLVEGHKRGQPREEARRAQRRHVVALHHRRAQHRQQHHRAIEVQQLAETLGDWVPRACALAIVRARVARGQQRRQRPARTALSSLQVPVPQHGFRFNAPPGASAEPHM